MTSKSNPTTDPYDGDHLRANKLGVWAIVFFVVAAAAPLVGMTGALPPSIVLGMGAAAPGAYLAVGLNLLLFSVGYAAMSHRVTNAGAFFAYVGRGLGQNFGLVTEVSETEVKLRELVQDASGDWTERIGAVQLQEVGK